MHGGCPIADETLKAIAIDWGVSTQFRFEELRRDAEYRRIDDRVIRSRLAWEGIVGGELQGNRTRPIEQTVVIHDRCQTCHE